MWGRKRGVEKEVAVAQRCKDHSESLAVSHSECSFRKKSKENKLSKFI